jgi:hypothetical protein
MATPRGLAVTFKSKNSIPDGAERPACEAVRIIRVVRANIITSALSTKEASSLFRVGDVTGAA